MTSQKRAALLYAGTSLTVLLAVSPSVAHDSAGVRTETHRPRTAPVPCATNTSYTQYNFTGGPQSCVITATGNYVFVVRGAGGGNARGGLGGPGAKVQATFPLTKGQVLQIIVGGQGGPGISPNCFDSCGGGGGGGGGGMVALAPASGQVFSTPLLIAGGGGGAGDGYPGRRGRVIEGMGAVRGGKGSGEGPGAGGVDGNGGVNSVGTQGGAGGAGFLTSGGFAATATGGIALIYGGAPGEPLMRSDIPPGGGGGFGGGGAGGAAGSGAGGGGGGYSGGGGGGYYSLFYDGGGGGGGDSYVAPGYSDLAQAVRAGPPINGVISIKRGSASVRSAREQVRASSESRGSSR